MALEKLKLTMVLWLDPRNPFSKIVFSPTRIGAEYDYMAWAVNVLTKESMVRTFRNIKNSKFMWITVDSDEKQLVFSLQELMRAKVKIHEMEIIYEIKTTPLKLSEWKPKNSTFNPVATLTLPQVKIGSIFLGEDRNHDFQVRFDLSGGSALVTY